MSRTLRDLFRQPPALEGNRSSPERSWLRAAALTAVVVVLGVGCAKEASSPGAQPRKTTGTSSFPVSVRAANGPVVVKARPDNIVSLSPTATEMLFAVGAGQQVVAVDDQSDYPPDVPTTSLSGFEPNVEAIVSYEPDLVVAASGKGLKSLKQLGIALLVAPAANDLEDVYAQVEQIGAATGHVAPAAEEVARIRSEIDEIVDSVAQGGDAPTYYHELDDTYFTVTSRTFIGQIYALAGLQNIADEAQGAGTGYPQLSAEYIIEADPDLIFLADSECCNQTPEVVARRPGWDQISAVKNNLVFDVGDDISSRWGPRVVVFLRRVVDAVAELRTAR